MWESSVEKVDFSMKKGVCRGCTAQDTDRYIAFNPSINFVKHVWVHPAPHIRNGIAQHFSQRYAFSMYPFPVSLQTVELRQDPDFAENGAKPRNWRKDTDYAVKELHDCSCDIQICVLLSHYHVPFENCRHRCTKCVHIYVEGFIIPKEHEDQDAGHWPVSWVLFRRGSQKPYLLHPLIQKLTVERRWCLKLYESW